MKAAILIEKNKPLYVGDVNLPKKLSFGQVKVRVLTSGLCGAQLQEIAGLKGNEKYMPHLIGHEGCGIVEDVGEDVVKVKKGDKVVMHWRKSSGIEANFAKYQWNDKEISGGKVTTLAEKVVISENRITPVSNDIDNEFCALLGCGLSTGFSVVNKDANVKFGESVLVIGCGGVGLSCIQASNLSLASKIIGIDINDEKRMMVEKLGAEFFSPTAVERIIESKIKIDCIIDTTGLLSLVSRFIPLLSNVGRCILVSQPKQGSMLSINDPIAFFSDRGQTIRTTQAGNFDPDLDIPRYISLYNKGLINAKSLVTDRYDIFNINEAIDQLKTGKSGRIIINF
jgi:S-(hydroxymethyl)glutathione dehydrogenase/alcohol dehydrogenase